MRVYHLLIAPVTRLLITCLKDTYVGSRDIGQGLALFMAQASRADFQIVLLHYSNSKQACPRSTIILQATWAMY